jgi:hypothetical protein
LKKHRERKAKTDIPLIAKDFADMEDFETPNKVGPPTANALKQLPKASISSTFSAFFKPVVVGGKQMLASSFGPQSLFQEQDILIEKDSSEESKGNT